MITIESNIEFLNYLKKWLTDSTQNLRPPALDSIVPNIDYAIETLKMVDKVKNDVWEEKRLDVIGSNGNTGAHYERN